MRRVLDTVVPVETPEGILLELRPAGLTALAYAFVLDCLILIAIAYASALAAAFIGGVGVAFLLILFFAREWLYPIAFELTSSGATPGKRVFGLKVVMDHCIKIELHRLKVPAAELSKN